MKNLSIFIILLLIFCNVGCCIADDWFVRHLALDNEIEKNIDGEIQGKIYIHMFANNLTYIINEIDKVNGTIIGISTIHSIRYNAYYKYVAFATVTETNLLTENNWKVANFVSG